jgi:ribosome modulation factor
MTTTSKYIQQGRRAHALRESRESCRFKAADIVRDWQSGWDAAAAEYVEKKRRAAIPRWQDTTHSSPLDW